MSQSLLSRARAYVAGASGPKLGGAAALAVVPLALASEASAGLLAPWEDVLGSSTGGGIVVSNQLAVSPYAGGSAYGGTMKLDTNGADTFVIVALTPNPSDAGVLEPGNVLTFRWNFSLSADESLAQPYQWRLFAQFRGNDGFLSPTLASGSGFSSFSGMKEIVVTEALLIDRFHGLNFVLDNRPGTPELVTFSVPFEGMSVSVPESGMAMGLVMLPLLLAIRRSTRH